MNAILSSRLFSSKKEAPYFSRYKFVKRKFFLSPTFLLSTEPFSPFLLFFFTRKSQKIPAMSRGFFMIISCVKFLASRHGAPRRTDLWYRVFSILDRSSPSRRMLARVGRRYRLMGRPAALTHRRAWRGIVFLALSFSAPAKSDNKNNNYD